MYIIKGLHSCRTKLNILNAFASYRCFLFKISTTSHVVHMLIFVIRIRNIKTKLLKSCSESQKLLKVAKIGKSSKVAQKLPSTICLSLLETDTMSKMGEEDSVFVRLLIQGTSTKNFYFIPSPQSAVRVLYLVRVLYPVRIFQSAIYT